MIYWICLKFGEHVPIILMHLPIKHLSQGMHEYQEKNKMVVGDGDQFLKNCALELAEIP